jgi:hypothetical protein
MQASDAYGVGFSLVLRALFVALSFVFAKERALANPNAADEPARNCRRLM